VSSSSVNPWGSEDDIVVNPERLWKFHPRHSQQKSPREN
jgi:hypothetical protein